MDLQHFQRNGHFGAILKLTETGHIFTETGHPRHWHFHCGHRPFFECMIFHFRWPFCKFYSVCGKNDIFACLASWGKLTETGHPRHWHFHCGHRPFFECMIFLFHWPSCEIYSVCGKNTVFACLASWGKLPTLDIGTFTAVTGHFLNT